MYSTKVAAIQLAGRLLKRGKKEKAQEREKRGKVTPSVHKSRTCTMAAQYETGLFKRKLGGGMCFFSLFKKRHRNPVFKERRLLNNTDGEWRWRRTDNEWILTIYSSLMGNPRSHCCMTIFILFYSLNLIH